MEASFAFTITHAPGSKSPVRWPQPNHVTYRVNPAGSDNIDNGSDLAAIHESFADWAGISCVDLTVEHVGECGNVNLLNGGDSNGENDVTWVEDNSWSFGSYVLGVTAPLYNFQGTILEADIALNGYLNKWSTANQASWNKLDVKSTAVHEVGHLFGVQHNLGGWPMNEPPTMAPSSDGTLKSRTLEEDDKLAACFLYPAGETYACSDDDECPYVIDHHEVSGDEYYSAKYVCESGECILDQQAGSTQGLGDACSTSIECEGDLFCQPLSDGTAICTHLCTPGNANTCEEGYNCASYQGGGGGACVPGDPNQKSNGAECGASSECKSGLCTIHPTFGIPQCQPACNVSEGSSQCPSGSVCIGLPGAAGPQGACWPTSDLGGVNKFDDETCEADFQCKSGLCVLDAETDQGYCRAPCDPDLDNCSAGTWCMELAEGFGACVPGEGPPPPVLLGTGGICEEDPECASEHCFQPLGSSVGQCAEFCVLDGAIGCPEGTMCIGYGSPGVGVCLPEGIPTGEECEDSSQCASQICMFNNTTGTGYCSQPCWAEAICPCDTSCLDIPDVGPVCLPDDQTHPCDASPDPEEGGGFSTETGGGAEAGQESSAGGGAVSIGNSGGGGGGCSKRSPRSNAPLSLVALVVFLGMQRRRSPKIPARG